MYRMLHPIFTIDSTGRRCIKMAWKLGWAYNSCQLLLFVHIVLECNIHPISRLFIRLRYFTIDSKNNSILSSATEEMARKLDWGQKLGDIWRTSFVLLRFAAVVFKLFSSSPPDGNACQYGVFNRCMKSVNFCRVGKIAICSDLKIVF